MKISAAPTPNPPEIKPPVKPIKVSSKIVLKVISKSPFTNGYPSFFFSSNSFLVTYAPAKVKIIPPIMSEANIPWSAG